MQQFSSVTHEMRTPLNCSLQMLSNLKSKINKKLIKEFLNPVISSLQILLSLINDILDLSQINAKKFKFVFNKCKFTTIVKEVLKLIQIQAQLKNIQLICDINPNCPNFITTDPNRLR